MSSVTRIWPSQSALAPMPMVGILVTEDMLGMFDWSPKFVRRYANLRETIGQAADDYARDIRAGAFPGEAELYRLKRTK